MAEERIERRIETQSGEVSEVDERWHEVEESLRRRLGRGALTLAQAEQALAEAPDVRLSEGQIQGLVSATIRRAREATQSAEHWHVWIGTANQAVHGEMTLHVTGVVGAKVAVAAVRRTVHTPNWSIVSVSSLDESLEVAPVPSDPPSVCSDYADDHSWDVSVPNAVVEDCWQFATDVTLTAEGTVQDSALVLSTLDDQRRTERRAP